MKHLKLFEHYNNDNFAKWFGDSKVVDDNGNPLKVYHGTSDDFDTFKPPIHFNAIGGYYFTDSFELANDYGHYQIPVYLRIENPYVMDAQGGYYEDIADEMNKNVRYYKDSETYDGMIISNIIDTREGGREYDEDGDPIDHDTSTVYVTFKPNQIKNIKSKSFMRDSDNIYENNNNKL